MSLPIKIALACLTPGLPYTVFSFAQLDMGGVVELCTTKSSSASHTVATTALHAWLNVWNTGLAALTDLIATCLPLCCVFVIAVRATHVRLISYRHLSAPMTLPDVHAFPLKYLNSTCLVLSRSWISLLTHWSPSTRWPPPSIPDPTTTFTFHETVYLQLFVDPHSHLPRHHRHS